MVESRVVAIVHGRVQGVGFRAWVRRLLVELDLDGTAANLPDGTVRVTAAGDSRGLERLLAALRGPHTPGSVTSVDATWSEG